ncbi:MAG TPA: permease-like cell division protein FtsX [Candidatus Limnocylindria bacterium]|jgi:cell division transport system permease protein|nr:permease-like cell division protein FtsX [Candidatus Limnocylindria bacterium]
MPLLRFVAFSVVRAWQGFWRNAMMSLAATSTVVLMLVLLSGLLIVLAGLDSGLQYIESKVGVTARLQDNLAQDDVDALKTYIEGLDGVLKVDYVSPELALERLKHFYEEQGQTLDLGGAEITLYASVEIALTDANQASAVASALEDRPEVELITTQQENYDKLLGIIGYIRTVGFIALALVGLTVLFMIVNMIRIAVYSRSGEIEIMRLVGASDSFIRWPFILEGILCGVIGAIVTIILVAVAWEPIKPIMVRVFQMPTAVSTEFLAVLSAVILGIGLGVGALGSWISVRANLASAA